MIPVSRKDGTLRGGFWQFLGRRAKRILPPYYSALGLSLVLIYLCLNRKTGNAWDFAIPVTKSDILAHIFMLHDIFSRPKIDNPLWSISVEWRIYFLFPLFVLFFRKSGSLKTVLGTLVSSVFMFLAFQHTHLDGTMPSYYTLFTIGMLACEISWGHQERLRRLRDRLPWLAVGCPIFCIYLILLYIWRDEVSGPRLFVMDILTGAFSGMFLIALSKPGTSQLREWLSWPPLVFIGTFAYSIYLVHMPLLQLVWQYGFHLLHLSYLSTYLLMVLVGVPLVIGTIYLFFLAFEKPFLNTKRRETMLETARDAALAPAP